MKNKYLRRTLIAAAALLAAALAYGLYRYFEPVAGLDDLKTDIQLTDAELLTDFENSPETAELKYRNKVLEISGTVAKVETDSAGGRIIFDQKGKFIIVAACTKDDREKIAAIEQNQEVRVKGVYTGYVIIDDMYMIPGEIKIDPCTLIP